MNVTGAPPFPLIKLAPGRRARRAHALPILMIGLLVLGSGVLNIESVIGPSLPERLAQLRPWFPLEVIDSSRSLVLLLGFAQIVSAWQVWQRKRRAWWLSLALAVIAPVLHLVKGLDYEEAGLGALLLAGLWLTRGSFTVRSREIHWGSAAARVGLTALLTVAYGVAGFWLLDPTEFGVDFHWDAAIRQTLQALTFSGNPELAARTAYANWFLESLVLIAALALLYAAWTLFRPALYRFRIRPHDAAEARGLVAAHGRCAQDHFKTSLDKSFFFSSNRRAFLAYRVGADQAIVLGDPVGPPTDSERAIREFLAYCEDNDWRVAFHQATPEMLPVYQRLGLKSFKLGDEAIVDLEQFTLEGKKNKAFRTTLNLFERIGVTSALHPAPVPEAVLAQAEQVSEEWLRLPGRRERRFTLGKFDRDELRRTPLLAAYDADGRMLGFINLVPSFRPGEATLDLMRRRTEGPNGLMDYLFLQAFAWAKREGFTRFNLGMVPMSGFQPGERSSLEERALHGFFQNLQFVFSFQGLRAFKAKFATGWEPLYIVYQGALDLPRLPVALSQVSELPEEE